MRVRRDVTPLRRLLLPLLAILLALPAGQAMAADEPQPTTLGLTSSTAEAMIDTPVQLTATLTSNGAPAVGQQVVVQNHDGTTWRPVATGTTDVAGVLTVPVTLTRTVNRYQAVYAGDATHLPSTAPMVTITGKPWSPVLVIGGSTRVVDETAGSITATWRAQDGRPVAGARVRLYHLPRGARSWSIIGDGLTNANGVRAFTIRPRVDTRYRLFGFPGRWWSADVSSDRFVDNVPPARPWRDPASAPRPKPLPAQMRAWGAGANVVVKRIPDAVWNHMTGISWHRGCPVGRSGLRLISTNYWGFDGYRHRGQLVVNAGIVHKYRGALQGLHSARIPIRAMYRVDRFGYSSRSGGGNDFASMAHDNTSAFNCRWVTGNPGVRSPHSTGRSWDINTWENPYRSRVGWLPNSWWAHRSDPRVAWRTSDHQVVRILRANGFRWTYAGSDAQHFDGRVAVGGITFSG